MKKLSIIILLSNPLLGQVQNVNIFSNIPANVTSSSASAIGNKGIQTYYYWIIANYPIGSVAPTTPALVINAFNPLSVTNYVAINWTNVNQASSYDIIRTTTSFFPGSCNVCAVTTGASNGPINDQGSILTNYTFNSVSPANLVLYLDNQSSSLVRIRANLNGRVIGWGQDRGPTNPTICLSGEIYYNTTLDLGQICNNAGSWVNMGSGGGNTVTCAPSGGIICTVSLNNVQLSIDTAIIAPIITTQGGSSPTVCVDSTSSGSTTNFAVSCGSTLTAYSTNQALTCIFKNTNNSSPNINFDSLGNKPIVNGDGTAIATSAIKPGLPYSCSYDGTSIRLAEAWSTTVTPGSYTNTNLTVDQQGRITAASNGSGGSSTNFSCGGVSSTMTGSDVTMCTFTNVSLGVGACLEFKGSLMSTVASLLKIKVGSTVISQLNNVDPNDANQWDTLYCNNPGVQNAQTTVPLFSQFGATYAQGSSPSTFWLENVGTPYPATPTAVDWSSNQTITVVMNAASGTGNLYAFAIR